MAKWAPLKILGDKQRAGVFLRFAKQRWLDLKNSSGAGSRNRSFRPAPDVLVRVAVNPHWILIKANPVKTRIWYGRAFVDKYDDGFTPLAYGHMAQDDHRVATAKSIRYGVTSKYLPDFPDSLYQFKTNNYRQPHTFRSWETGQAEMHSWLVKPTDPLPVSFESDVESPVGISYVEFEITEDSGENWRNYVGGWTTTLHYIGIDSTSEETPFQRYILSTEGDLLFGTGNPNAFISWTPGLGGNYNIRWIGDTSAEMVDYFFFHSADTSGVFDNPSKRWITFDTGNTWYPDVGFPWTGRGVTGFSLYTATKLSSGNYLAICKDNDGKLYAWRSANGITGWSRQAEIVGVPADHDAYEHVYLIALDNDDAIFAVEEVYDYSLDPHPRQGRIHLFALSDGGGVAIKRPDIIDSSTGLDGQDWYTHLYLNAHRPLGADANTPVTVDSAVLVITAREYPIRLTGSDDGAGQPIRDNNYFYRNNQDVYIWYCEQGGSGSWTRGHKVSEPLQYSYVHGSVSEQKTGSGSTYFTSLPAVVGY